MIRKIVDYQKLNEDILNLMIAKFPEGYDDTDIISFKNAQNEVVEAVEVKTEDTIYLVKVGKRLAQAMEDYEDSYDSDSSTEDETPDHEQDLMDDDTDDLD